MAKGYMIFVDGGEPPKKVHINVHSAWREMQRLSTLLLDRQIMILRVEKRMMRKDGEDKAISIGSHLPPDNINSTVDMSQLVRRACLAKATPGGQLD